MEAKISKTVRLSTEVIQMIESQAGENFTAKFEALVTRCMWELPKKEQELAGIQERIQYERKQLTRIQKRVRELNHNMTIAEQAGQNYIYSLRNVIKRLDDTIEEL